MDTHKGPYRRSATVGARPRSCWPLVQGGVLFVVVGLLVFSGCAFTQAKLDVAYQEATARKGPLALAASRDVEIGTFTDTRTETDKIGYKKNGFGQKAATIVTKRPVPDIVRNAVVTELKLNGHNPGRSGSSSLVLEGDVTTFWFDLQSNLFTVDFLGTVAMELRLRDPETGRLLLARTYQGHYAEKSRGGLDGTWERVMNVALERMIREMSTDRRLLEALRTGPPTEASSAAAR